MISSSPAAWGRASCVGLLLLAGFSASLEAQDAEPPRISIGPVVQEADPGFTSLRNLRELPDGRVLIADSHERALYLIDFSEGGAGAVRQVGRTGGGPEEYARPMWVYPIGRDSTLLADGMRRWLILEGADLVATRTQRDSALLNYLEFDGITSMHGLSYIGLTYAETAMPAGHETADSIQPILMRHPWDEDPSFPTVDTVDVVLRGAGPGGINGCAMAVGDVPRRNREPEVRLCRSLVQAEDRAFLFPDGWMAVAYLDPYRVDWRRPDGSWVRGTAVEESVPEMTLDEQCAAAQGWNFRGIGRCSRDDLEGREVPTEYLPFVRESSGSTSLVAASPLLAASDGRLLIRRTPTSRSFMFTRYDVFDRSGARVGRIQLTADQAILGFGANSVYTVRTDDVDLQWVRKHAWPPAG